MKKAISTLFCIIMLVAFAACETAPAPVSGTESVSETSTAASTPEPVTSGAESTVSGESSAADVSDSTSEETEPPAIDRVKQIAEENELFDEDRYYEILSHSGAVIFASGPSMYIYGGWYKVEVMLNDLKKEDFSNVRYIDPKTGNDIPASRIYLETDTLNKEYASLERQTTQLLYSLRQRGFTPPPDDTIGVGELWRVFDTPENTPEATQLIIDLTVHIGTTGELALELIDSNGDVYKSIYINVNEHLWYWQKRGIARGFEDLQVDYVPYDRSEYEKKYDIIW